MALDQATQDKIVLLTNEHWAAHVKDPAFAKLIRGKEPGQTIAHYVDSQTTMSLKNEFTTHQQIKPDGSSAPRSMGDLWLHSGGIYNPVNIKTGLQRKRSQPNMVAMNRLLTHIFSCEIDSYYLLIIKFDLAESITHKVFLVDLLDWTDFITFDAGPGQTMLNEKRFYAAYESGYRPQERSIGEKIQSLFTLYEKKVESLIANRQRRLDRQRKLFEGFTHKPFVVNQSEMTFVP